MCVCALCVRVCVFREDRQTEYRTDVQWVKEVKVCLCALKGDSEGGRNKEKGGE